MPKKLHQSYRLVSQMSDLLDINKIRPIAASILKYKQGGTALDLGSGGGRHSLFLARNGFTVQAIDRDYENMAALKGLAKAYNLPIKVEPANLVSYEPKKKYDVVISTMVLHFLAAKSHADFIKKMQNATKRGGLNVLTTYTSKNPKGIKPFAPKAGWLKRVYEQAGWKVLEHFEGQGDPRPDPKDPKQTVRIWREDIIAQKI